MDSQRPVPNSEKPNVLLVDDRPENLLALEVILGDMPCRLLKASSGPEAIEVVQKNDLALILLDVQMPQMDGFETAQRIRQLGEAHSSPIIFVTAIDHSRENQRMAYRSGGVDFLYKPLDPEIVVSKVAIFLELYQARRKESFFREKAENKAAIHETLFRQIFSSNIMGLLLTDFKGRVLDANSAFLDMLGFSNEELHSLKINWQDLTPPEFRDISMAKIQEVREKGTSAPFEKEYFRKDGSRIPVLVGSSRIANSDGYDAVTFVLDISEKKKAEKEKNFSQRRFRALFEQSPVPLQIYEKDGTLVDVNHAWYKLFGTTEKDIAGYNVLQDMQVEALGLTAKISKAFQGETVHLAPFHYDPAKVQLKGRSRWLEIKAFPLKTEAGEVQEVALYESDVTDQVQALKALQESEENLKYLADSTPSMVWSAGVDKQIDYVNKAWLAFTGRDLQSEMGQGWMSRIHPDDRTQCQQIFNEAFDQKKSFEMEFRLQNKNRQYCWVLDRGNPRYDKTGNFIGYIGACIDITDRKTAEEVLQRSENQYRVLAESSVVLGASLEFQETLKGLTQFMVPLLADWCSIELATSDGRLEQLAVAHKDPDKVKWAWELNQKYPANMKSTHGSPNVLRTGKSEWMSEIPEDILKPLAADAEHWNIIQNLGFVSYICVPLKARNQIFGTLTLVTTKESGRKYTQQDLQLAEALAERASLAVDNARLFTESQNINRIKDEFLATLSHELRTPLNVIQGHADLLQAEGPFMSPEELQGSYEAIFRNAENQSRIISDLLDVSAIVTGKMLFRPESINPVDLLSKVVVNVQPTMNVKGITLKTDFAKAPQEMVADPTRLQQIVWNLLSNAAKFTPVSGQIELKLYKSDSEVKLEISDTGIGINPEFIPYMFDRFRQEDSSTTRRFGGLGLGLSISRHLVELHGGSIRAESKGKGLGATFIVTLPVYQEYRELEKPGFEAPTHLSSPSVSSSSHGTIQ